MSDYFATQAQQNTRYKAEYAKWVAGLTPKQRRQLQAQGLLEAQVDPLKTGKTNDVSELPLTAEEVVTETSEDADEESWAALRLMIADLLADPNPALGVDCLALVSGIGFMGESMTAIAKRHGVTRAAVSKRCVQITEQLNLLPSRSMKSLTARKVYRTAQKKHYEHRERFDHRRTRNDH
jgi:hypothetical protein